jgi:hypothetical protein
MIEYWKMKLKEFLCKHSDEELIKTRSIEFGMSRVLTYRCNQCERIKNRVIGR